jgi:hypothetical protein
MKYIIIIVMAISVNAIIIYMLGNKVLGVGLRLKSLMMCGFCALFLSLVLPRVAVGLTSRAGTIGFFAIFTIILAGFVVYYDDMEEIRSASNSSMDIALESDSLSELEDLGQNAFQDTGGKVGIDTVLVDLVDENMESTRQYLNDSPSDQVIKVEKSTISTTSGDQPNSELLLEPVTANSLYGESSILEVIAENVENIIPTGITDDELADISIREKDSMLMSEPEVMFNNKGGAAPEDFKATDSMEIMQSQPVIGPASNSLDDLLECAFSYKKRGEDSCALDTFKCALELYRDKEVAPFLVIEIADLLKNEGAYDEAITLLTESRNLLGLHEKHGLDQDFINTIAYLRIIKNTLSESHFGYIPLGKIPAEILEKIDDEFREWRKSF